MKKTLLAILFITLTMAAPDLCHAITGVCSNCHTMHNSQGGSGVVQTYDGVGNLATGENTPIDYLLKASCIACHTGDTGTGGINNFNAPVVLHISLPGGQGASNTLAGGDFYWVAKGLGADDNKGHNVVGISSQDSTIATGLVPPGWDATATPGENEDGQIAGGTWDSQLTCAGKYGCHGNHTETSPFSAIQRSHHSNDNLTSTEADSDVSTIGKSFRFLSGIRGLEDIDWQWTETASDHNEYFGIDGNDDYETKTTISYSCAQCHGAYHDTDVIGTASPWTRHPTDITLPDTGEYSSYNPGGSNQYSLMAPVARPSVPSLSGSTVTEGDSSTDAGAIVMCLSCHRAHGSPNSDLMRWNNQANMDGCVVCHTSKS